MVDFKGLIEGMNVIQKITVGILAVYSTIVLSIIFLGTLFGVAAGLSVIPPEFIVTLNETAVSFNAVITTLFEPIVLIIQLVIIVVLVVVFALGGLFGGGKSKGRGSSDIL